MKIHFYLDRRKEKNKRLPVFIQFWLDGQLFRSSTGEHCNPEDWDNDNERIRLEVNGASEVNRLFQSMQDEVFSLIRNAKTARIPLNINYIKENLSFLSGKEKNFFSLLEDFIRIGFDEKKWGEGMVRRLDILKMHLKNIDKLYKIEFSSINEEFYKAFLHYNERQRFNISYAIKNLELLRWFMNWASVEGYNRNMTYRKFKSPAAEKINYDELYLTEEELMKLFRLETNNTELELVKDMFCLSCFTGLRHSDLAKLDDKNLLADRLVIRRLKPPMTIEIPLNDMARIILDRYYSDTQDRLFPPITIQDYNRNLKELGRQAGINTPVRGRKLTGDDKVMVPMKKWELMSSLFARRTFINLGVNRGIGLEVMCELTGNRAGTINHYYKIKDVHKIKEMQKLNIY